jgi:hypothetical protein
MAKDDSVEEKYFRMTIFKNNSKDPKLPLLIFAIDPRYGTQRLKI